MLYMQGNVVLKIKVFLDVAPCRLVRCYQHFGEALCLYLQDQVFSEE